MTGQYAVRTRTGARGELPEEHGRTAPNVDRYLDPFGGRPQSYQVLDSDMWFTAEAVEDALGVLGVRTGPNAVAVPVNGIGCTRVSSRPSPRTVRILFNLSELMAQCGSGVLVLSDAVLSDTTKMPAVIAPGPVIGGSESAGHLESSLTDVQAWLGIGLQQAAEAAGISRGTVYAWRDRESVPRPSTVHNILRLHGLVASAVRTVGKDPAQRWFHTGDPSPLEQLLQGRGDDEVMRQVSKRIRRELTTRKLPSSNPWLAANLADESE
ncbi:MAG: hypothetical protein QOG75_2142 [Mycobacterium sp.]|nr:hypothetical protein [Mycobacterium sp.]